MAGLLLMAFGSGCATSALDTARGEFYNGHPEAGVKALTPPPGDTTDRVLVLMERGTMHQATGDYADSVEDWLRAKTLADQLDYISVSRESASMVVNDRLLSFRGAPYERVLLHALAAESYLSMGLWQDAGVEGRGVIRRLESRGDFPDDAYSRYVTALSLELAGDDSGAVYQYRKASEIAAWCAIDPKTGALGPHVDTNALPDAAAPPPAPSPPRSKAGSHELVCLVSIGRGPTGGESYAGSNWRWGSQPYAEIYDGDTYLGRSYVLARTDVLAEATKKVLALRKTVKTAGRVALKETAAQVVSQQDELLGDLLRLILFAMESPDTRQWETLPQWLGVARVPCPADLHEYRVVLKTGSGHVVEQRVIQSPLMKRGRTTVSRVRAL